MMTAETMIQMKVQFSHTGVDQWIIQKMTSRDVPKDNKNKIEEDDYRRISS